jgi:hypothetical protein
MKQSLIVNAIQYIIPTTAGTSVSNPGSTYLLPCGKYITSIRIAISNPFIFRLRQANNIIFPVRTSTDVSISGGFLNMPTNSAVKYLELVNLFIPVKPDYTLTLEYAENGATSLNVFVILTMASEDERSILLDIMNDNIKKLFAKEIK